MSIRHAVSLLSALACLLGCGLFNSELSLDELRQLAAREKIAIYFTGQPEPMPKFAEKLGSVEGKVCQATMISSTNEYQALSAMWSNAKAKKATAVVDASCGSVDFLLPVGGGYCYPGYYCKGEAVK